MFWSFKVNKALAQLGIDPAKISGEYRRMMQQLGKMGDYTPEETALFIVSQMPAAYQLNTDAAIAVWQRDGKLDLTKPDMKKAMGILGTLDSFEYRRRAHRDISQTRKPPKPKPATR